MYAVAPERSSSSPLQLPSALRAARWTNPARLSKCSRFQCGSKKKVITSDYSYIKGYKVVSESRVGISAAALIIAI